MSKKRETLQDYLDGKVEQENKIINTKNTNNKKQNKVTAIIALLLAGVTAIGCFVGFKNKKNKNNNEELTTTPIQTQFSIDNLGVEEEFPINSQYGNTTGDVKKENIVEKDGIYYADKESADNAHKVGQTSIDTQNGKLEVKPDGTVVDKETGFEVKDENGEVVTKGDNEEDLLKDYIVLDRDYYYKDGTLAFKKGDIVNKKDFERVKKYLITDLKDVIKEETTTQVQQETTTTKPETTTQPSTTQQPTQSSSQGVVNSNGTYTIYGVTYADKATFQAIALSDVDEIEVEVINGVIHLKQTQAQTQKTK